MPRDNFVQTNTRRALTRHTANADEREYPRFAAAARNRTSLNSTPDRSDTPNQVAESPPATVLSPIRLSRKYIRARRNSPAHAIEPPSGISHPAVSQTAT